MRNIKLKYFIKLEDVSEYASLNHVKGDNLVNGKRIDINSLPYSNIKYCLKIINKENKLIDVFKICFDLTDKQFYNLRILEFCKLRNYLINTFVKIAETERKIFAKQSVDDEMWKMAGAERLNPFSDTIPLVQLGKALGQYPFDLGRKPYSEIFSLLAQLKIQNEVETEFNKFKNNG